MRFKGSNNLHTRIICAYVPASNTFKGTWSAYDQQVRGLCLDGLTGHCPRAQFWVDLEREISKWQSQGDQLILAGDWNTDVRSIGLFTDYNLHEVLIDRHGSNGPGTHHRGSVPIDGIFCSDSLRIHRGGYLGFQDICGDHRGLWIDLPIESIIGFRMPSVIIPSARRLQTDNPKVVRKYVDEIYKVFKRHNLFNRIASVHASTTYPLAQEVADEYEQIDVIRTRGMLSAERKCRHLHHGAVPWSPVFAEARNRVKFWLIQQRRVQGFKINTRGLLRLGRRLHIPDYLPTRTEISRELRIARHKYREAKENGRKNRNTFLESLAQAKSNNDEEKAAAFLTRLLEREEQRESSRRIKYVTGKLSNTSCSYVDVTAPDGTVSQINSQRELESAIIRENVRKYSQAHSCPLLHGTLRQDIGFLGDGPAVDAILKGTYAVPPGTPLSTKEFLDAMAAPPGLEFEDSTYSLDDYRLSWKKARESTSSGEIHYGHFKACAQDPLLSWCNYLLVEIPFTSGHIPQRWKKATDVMLLKKEGNHAIDKLRTIVLYEADFNMHNKVMGRQAMHSALQSNAIAPEQYSRPQRSAIDHALNRQLVFDHCAARHTPYSLCSCDLQGCYDRIVHSAAILALRRVGVSASRLTTMFGTIQAAIHRVRTVYGDSSSTYSWSSGHFTLPPQGTGQGHGAGPQIWSVLSSVLFSILQDKGFTSSFINALTNELFHLSGFAYVDDCDMIQLGTSIEGVIETTQRALSKWESLIHSTGGSLAPSKCWWYLVDHTWHKGKWHAEDPILDFDLTATDKNGIVQPIRRLNISEAQEMLGVYMAPDGNTAPQVKALKDKARLWAAQIEQGFLPSQDVWTAMTCGIIKALQYPLPALLLSRDECRSILTPVIEAGLPRCGLTRKLPLAIRNGPVAFGGLGLPDLYLHMGVTRVQKLVEHMWLSTPTTKLIDCGLSNLLLEAGVSGNIFGQPFRLITSYLHSTSWLRHTLEFMDEYSIKLSGSFPELTDRREHDVALMTGFMEKIEDKRTLHELNICRLYLRCSHLSDISTSSGQQIQPRFFGTPNAPPIPTTPSQRRYRWPDQPAPPKSWWNTWRKSLQLCFLTTDKTLHTTLGRWLPSDLQENWDWFLSIDGKHLWSQPVRGTWISFPKTSLRSQRARRFQTNGTRVQHGPAVSSIQRTTVVHNRNSIDAQPGSQFLPRTPSVPPVTLRALFAYFLREEPDAHWIASTITISPSIDGLMDDFVMGKAIGVSDGSFFASTDTGAMEWTIENSDRTEFIRAGGIIPGHLQSTYRSELGGLYGLTLGFYALWRIRPTSSNVLIACDGIGALKKSLASEPARLTTNCLHFDFISSIMKYWTLMEQKQFPVHVRGHMDNVRSSLSQLESMNVDMDHLAQARAIHHMHSNNDLQLVRFHAVLPRSRSEVNASRVTCKRHYWRNVR